MRRCLFASLSFLLLPTGAWAQADPSATESTWSDESEHLTDAARALFRAGMEAVDRGEFSEAADLLRRSSELHDSSVVRFNLALALSEIGQTEQARAHFGRIAAGASNPELRAIAAERLAALDAAPPERREERDGRDAGPEPGARPGPGPPVGEILLTSFGALAVAAGSVLLGLGVADYFAVEGAERPSRWTDFEEANGRAPIFTGLGIGMLAAGGVAVIAGLVWLSLGSDEAEVALGPGFITLRGRL